MSPGVANKHLEGVGLSSMWTEGLAEGSPRDIRQSLLLLSRSTCAYRLFQNGLRRMAGLTDQIVENEIVHFSPKDVAQIGVDLQTRMLVKAGTPAGGIFVLRRPPDYHLQSAGAIPLLNENTEYITNERGETILTFTSGSEQVSFVLAVDALYPRYVVPLPAGYLPSVISAAGRDLVVGLDFTLGEDCMVFLEPPEKLFPDNSFLLRSAETSTTAPLSFTLQADGLRSGGRHVARYLRESQSLNAFRLAALEAGGVALTPEAGILQAVKSTGPTARYIFEDFVVSVSYTHTPLVIGNYYEQFHPIGEALQVFGPTGGNWWRALDWSQGLSLDGLCPFSGLTVSDQITKFYSVDGHYRFALQGPAETQAKFWEHVRQSEVLAGRALGAIVPVSPYLNPIDVIFQYLLGSRAVIVKMDTDALGGARTKQVLDFIRREHPVGSVIITTSQPLAQL